jgi:hypothetical protein
LGRRRSNHLSAGRRRRPVIQSWPIQACAEKPMVVSAPLPEVAFYRCAGRRTFEVASLAPPRTPLKIASLEHFHADSKHVLFSDGEC